MSANMKRSIEKCVRDTREERNQETERYSGRNTSPEIAGVQPCQSAHITTFHPSKWPGNTTTMSVPLSPIYRRSSLRSSNHKRPSPPLAGVCPVLARREIADRRENGFGGRKSTFQELPMSKSCKNFCGSFLGGSSTYLCHSNGINNHEEERNQFAGMIYEDYNQHFPPLIATKSAMDGGPKCDGQEGEGIPIVYTSFEDLEMSMGGGNMFAGSLAGRNFLAGGEEEEHHFLPFCLLIIFCQSSIGKIELKAIDKFSILLQAGPRRALQAYHWRIITDRSLELCNK